MGQNQPCSSPSLVGSRFFTKFSLVFSYFHPILDIIRLLNANPGDAFVHKPDLEKHMDNPIVQQLQMEVNYAETKSQSHHYKK
jgi:hypothetical protein